MYTVRIIADILFQFVFYAENQTACYMQQKRSFNNLSKENQIS